MFLHQLFLLFGQMCNVLCFPLSFAFSASTPIRSWPPLYFTISLAFLRVSVLLPYPLLFWLTVLHPFSFCVQTISVFEICLFSSQWTPQFSIITSPSIRHLPTILWPWTLTFSTVLATFQNIIQFLCQCPFFLYTE